MAIINKLTIVMLLGLLLSLYPTVSADPPVNSPAPPPHAGTDSVSPALETPPSSSPPASSPEIHPPSSPPAPSLDSSPAPVPGGPAADEETPNPSPVPGPEKPSDAGSKEDVDEGNEDSGASGMSGGKKAGIALGVIAAVCVVGAGALVYKKRQQNIRRSEYGYRGILMEAFSGRD